jgi:hypothetical protein
MRQSVEDEICPSVNDERWSAQASARLTPQTDWSSESLRQILYAVVRWYGGIPA